MNLYENIKKNLKESSSNQPAYVICYGQLEIWPNVESAKAFYREGMDACEGYEQERYMNIVYSLGHGNFFADDLGPEKVTSIVDRDENGNIKTERVHSGAMTHEQAINYITRLQNMNIKEADNASKYQALVDNCKNAYSNNDLETAYKYWCEIHDVLDKELDKYSETKEDEAKRFDCYKEFNEYMNQFTNEEVYDITDYGKQKIYSEEYGLKEAESYTDEEKEEFDLDEEGYDKDGEKWIHCEWCNELVPVYDCKKELNLGWICDRCQNALYSRGEKPVYDEYAVYEESEKLKESEAKILDFEETGGGVFSYVGEVGNYNFVGDIDGSIEFFDKKFGINDWGKYTDIEDNAWNGKYGSDIKGTYDFEQKYAEFKPEYLKDISQALKDYVDNNIKEPHYASQVYDEVKRMKNYKEE